MLLPEVVGGIIGSLPCHYPGAMLITGTPELLHPAWVGIGTGTGYGMVLALGMLVARVWEKLYYPSLVIDASASTKHMFRNGSVGLLILTLKTMHALHCNDCRTPLLVAVFTHKNMF